MSEPQLDSPEFAKYSQGDIVGKAGIERQYNDILIGVDGQRQEIVDNMGRSRGVVGLKEAVPGPGPGTTCQRSDAPARRRCRLTLWRSRDRPVADPNATDVAPATGRSGAQ